MTNAGKLVTGGVIAALLGGLWYALRFGSNWPMIDEWDLILESHGNRFHWRWLFAWQNEHRYPLGKLVWLAGLSATGYQFQTGMILSLILLTAAAGMLLDATSRLAGKSSLGDLLIPALLLHWGHGFNLLVGYQTTFVLFTLGLCGLLWSAVRKWPLAGVAFATVIAQSGGFGLASVPALVLSLAWLPGGRGRFRGVAIVLIVAYSAWVAIGMPTRATAEPVSLTRLVAAMGQYLMVGWGAAATAPDALSRFAAGSATGALMIAAAVGIRRIARTPDHRIAGVLALTLIANLCVAAAVAYGRGGGLGERFVTTSAAGLAIAWVAVRTGRLAPTWLGVTLAVAVFASNIESGLRYGAETRDAIRRLEVDIAGGLCPEMLSGRHGGAAQVLVGDHLADALRLLRDGPIPRFYVISQDRVFRRIRAGRPHPSQIVCDSALFQSGKPVPRCHLPPPGQQVIGLELAVTQHYAEGFQSLWLCWIDRTGPHRRKAYPLVTPGTSRVAFGIEGKPSEIWLEPGCPMRGVAFGEGVWLTN